MTSISLAAAVLGAITFAFAGTALADGGYGSQPGFDRANANTPCAGHGAFGAFGAFGATGDVYHDFGINSITNGNGAAPGADGTATGLANSGLCGNR